MADQKTDDTKSPLARRGPRPFAGPGAAPSAARPFLRPATPSQRATAAPFAPVVPPPRPALGGQPPLKPVAAPPVIRKPTPIVAPAIAPPAMSVSSIETVAAAAETLAVAPPTAMPDADPFFGGVPTPSATSAVEPLPTRSRPITSEMVALDAFDAFDPVWETAERHATVESAPAPEAQPAELQASTPPLDEISLGSALEAQHPWAEEITAGEDPSVASMPTPVDDEPTHPTPGFAMPAWLADDSEPVRSPSLTSEPVAQHATADDDVVEDDQAPWPIVASDYGYSAADWAEVSAAIPAADDLSQHHMPDVSAEMALGELEATAADEIRPRFELVEDAPIGAPHTHSAVDPRLLHALRISGSLDRLAQRVRDGEIDVSSIAPEATDAAVLASVLAALLGGSSSR